MIWFSHFTADVSVSLSLCIEKTHSYRVYGCSRKLSAEPPGCRPVKSSRASMLFLRCSGILEEKTKLLSHIIVFLFGIIFLLEHNIFNWLKRLFFSKRNNTFNTYVSNPEDPVNQKKKNVLPN